MYLQTLNHFEKKDKVARFVIFELFKHVKMSYC